MNITYEPTISDTFRFDPPQRSAEFGAAICAVMAEVRRLEKKGRNEFAKYDYTSSDDFKDAIRPLFAKHGVDIEIEEEGVDFKEIKDEKEKQKFVVAYRFSVTLMFGREQSKPTHITVVLPFVGPQTTGIARSYALKEWLKGRFLLTSGDTSDEADALASGGGGQRLSKAEGRETYSRLQEELAAVDANAKDASAVNKWFQENLYRIEVLPQDWYLSFRAEAQSRHKALKERFAMEQAALPSPEAFMQSIVNVMREAQTVEALHQAWIAAENSDEYPALSEDDAARLSDEYELNHDRVSAK